MIPHWIHFKPFHPNVSRAALVAGLSTIGMQQTLLQSIFSAKLAAIIAGVCLIIAAVSSPAQGQVPQPVGPPPPEASGHA